MSDIPKRRGRPPKAAVGLESKAPAAAPVRAAPPIAQRPDFLFSLSASEGLVRLRLADTKGRTATPDYRRYGGAVRDALREFTAELRKDEGSFRWSRSPEEIGEAMVFDPPPRLIDLVSASGLLADGTMRPLRCARGDYRLAIRILNIAGGWEIKTVIVDGDGSVLERGSEGRTAAPLVAVSPNHVLTGSVLYRTEDLGAYWAEAGSLGARIKRDDLAVFLSLALSRFSSLRILYDGFLVRKTRPRVAVPALIFKEIDAYGYLHIRPVAFLPGYPPGFFEDQDIIKVVEPDEAEKILGVSEVVFPVSAEEEFRNLLSRSGKEVKTAVYEEAGIFILAPDFAERFLSENMARLIADFTLFEAAILTRFKVRPAAPRLRISLGAGIEYLEGRAEVEVDGHVFSYGRFLAEFKKQGYLSLNDGTRAFPDAADIARFERLIAKTKGADDAVAVSFFDLPVLAKEQGIEADGESWARADRFYRSFNDLASRDGDFSLAGGTLRPYQEYGVKWLEHLRDHSFGGCLADDMGLGKTVQVISLLKRAYRGGLKEPSLILMPRSLLFNWKAEFARFAPELPCTVHYGTSRDTSAIRGDEALIVLSSYSTARNDITELGPISFAYLILDESQNIKNLETKTTSAVLALKARHRFALSGTPVENNLAELYSLFRFLNPSFFGTRAEFTRDYLRPIQENRDEAALRDLKTRIYPFLLRRLKRDVLADLPPKTEQTVYIELDEEHLSVYHRRRMELKARIELALQRDGVAKSAFVILQAFTELRRLAGVPEADGEFGGVSAKREYLKETVGELVAGGHKCLIFTNFIASVELVSEDLSALGIGNLVMTGASVDREALVRRFQSDPDIGAFVMTLKTGGVGLNLTAADYVFIFDPWWNRAAENQAIDRSHRIGQDNPVFCYRMIAVDTIEEKILELQERKAYLVDSLLTADAASVKALDESDIEYLLG